MHSACFTGDWACSTLYRLGVRGVEISVGRLVGLMLLASGCSAAPRPSLSDSASAEPVPPRAVLDPCRQVPGEPTPAPLEREYTGLASRARCQPEVRAIMQETSHALGVSCSYCHVQGDYRAVTHRKRVANWMASELVPRLVKSSDGSDVWCGDCHSREGRARARILGDPRSEPWAIEWMTAHLVEDFVRVDDRPLRCKDCHRGAWGSPEFQRRVVLGDEALSLPKRSRP